MGFFAVLIENVWRGFSRTDFSRKWNTVPQPDRAKLPWTNPSHFCNQR